MKIRGDSVVVAPRLFQVGSDGSTPISPHQYKIGKCEFNEIRSIFERFHYKGGHIGGGISLCLGLTDGYEIVGGAVLGKLRQEQAYKKDTKRYVEIRRMACLDNCPKNTESYFLSKILWYLRKNDLADIVISYSDQTVGHKGTIYKAANFKCIGETNETIHVLWNGVRYHPRSLNIERPYSYKLREAVKNGSAVIQKGLPKLIYEYAL